MDVKKKTGLFPRVGESFPYGRNSHFLTFTGIFATVHRMKKGIDHIGVGVGAIIYGRDNKVFLAKRGKEAKNESGKWEFPGGSVEFGETLEHALAREIREEYGIEIEILSLLDVVNHIIHDEKQHWVSPSFICRITFGTPVIKEPHKCDEIGWFSLDHLPENTMTIASKKSLESLRKKMAGCQ
jgi:8-oxo-dGTP diphosphatase